MKERTKGIIIGAAVTCLIVGAGTTALAASGALTLEVVPVSIKVNNEDFKPKSSDGSDAMVFAYNGVTYAPLRALAEAYGLQVGWDQVSGTATVSDPDATPSTPDTTAPSTDYSSWSKEEEAAYQEFKGMWKIECLEMDSDDGIIAGRRDSYYAYPNDKNPNALDYWEGLTQQTQDKYIFRLMIELKGTVGIVLGLGESAEPAAIYGFSIFEDGTFYPGHS